MAKAQAAAPSPQNTALYRKQMEQVSNLRNGYKNLQGDYVHGFNEMAMATGRFHVETVKTVSASQALSKAIKDQKLTFGQLWKQRGGLQEVAREQTALRQAMSMQWTGSQLGKNAQDIYMPKGLGSNLDNARIKYGVINQAIRSAATQTVNWGKNMQWAGRQITVGIGVPIAMIVGAMGKMAYTMDQQLVRITKVYDTQSANIQDADQRSISTQNELANVRQRSMKLGISMAKTYGQSLNDTLSLEADLAATGKTGNELMQQTSEVTRIATLGELDHQKALNMSITLGTVFNQNAQQMGESFDYINAIENATSLSTQDFAEALPRAGSALHGLGMNLQEIGVLLVAMKAGGVDAAEGANALKSATSRLVKPTQQAKDLMWGYHINLEAIVNQSGGNLLAILRNLGKEMKNMTPVQKQQAMATIFGTYQFNKLNAVMSQLADTTAGYGDQQSQVARAFQTMTAGSESWAQTAAQEQAQMANSVSGKFKRAIETLKAEMATMGESFLGPITSIVNGLSAVFHWIGGLPKVVKVGMVALGAFGLIAGPIIMLIGLFGNLIGNVGKLAGWLADLKLRFTIMSKEERAQEILARRAASAFDSEASSVAKLTIELQNMIATMEKQYAMQAEMNGLSSATVAANSKVAASEAEVAAARNGATGSAFLGGAGKRKNSGSRNTQQGRATVRANQAAASEAAAARQMEAAALTNTAGAAGKIEDQAAKTKVSFGKVAGYMGAFAIGAYALHGMADSSGGLASNLMNAAMFVSVLAGTGVIGGITRLASLTGGALKKGTAAVAAGWHKAGDGVRYAYAQGKYFEGSVNGVKGSLKAVSTGIKSIGSSMLGFFGPGGLIMLGLAAAVAAFIAIKKYMDAVHSRQANINKSTSDWADILGYTEKIYGDITDAQGKSEAKSPYQARRKEVDELTSKNEDLVNSLKDAAKASDNFRSVYSLAMGEALKVKMSGGNKAQAKEAFQVALQASGISEQEIKTLSVKFDQVDLNDPATSLPRFRARFRMLWIVSGRMAWDWTVPA
jgi:TP901 family phage tail tape measure protein